MAAWPGQQTTQAMVFHQAIDQQGQANPEQRTQDQMNNHGIDSQQFLQDDTHTTAGENVHHVDGQGGTTKRSERGMESSLKSDGYNQRPGGQQAEAA